MLSRPIVNKISTYDAKNSVDVTFQVYGGNQVVKNKIVIERVSDNMTVYQDTITSFILKHTIPPNTLTNGIQYRAKIQTYDSGDNTSDYSDSVIFYCYSTPTITMNIIDGQLIENTNYIFTCTYSQLENEDVSGYRFYLYDSSKALISTSSEKYDESFSNLFDGFSDNGHYYVEMKVNTVHGLLATSGLIGFSVNYMSPTFNTALVLEQIDKSGEVKVNGHIIRIDGQIKNGTVTYENNDWCNLKSGVIYFDSVHGFTLDSDWNLRTWVKDIKNDSIIFTFSNGIYTIETWWINGKVKLYTKLNDRVIGCYSDTNVLTTTSNNVIFININKVNDRFDVNYQIQS